MSSTYSMNEVREVLMKTIEGVSTGKVNRKIGQTIFYGTNQIIRSVAVETEYKKFSIESGFKIEMMERV